jgi:hypothetical protein
MKTEWEVPFEDGACVFVVNHAGSSGPVDMCTKFPMREKIHPWINEELLSAKTVPAYARKGRWWKQDGFLAPVRNAIAPYIAAAMMPPVLRGTDYIPVYQDRRIMLTLRQSVRVLQKEHYLMLFPEIPGPGKTTHRRINTGWLLLGQLWYKASGRSLKMYPVHVDYKNHVFRVSAPVLYDPARLLSEQEQELAEKLVKGIRGEQ